MSSSTPIVVHPPHWMKNRAPYRFSYPSTSLIQSILIQSATHFGVSPYLLSLIPNSEKEKDKDKTKPIELSTPLRLSSLKQGQTLQLALWKSVASLFPSPLPLEGTQEGKLSPEVQHIIQQIKQQNIHITLEAHGTTSTQTAPLVHSFPLSSSLSSVIHHFQSSNPSLTIQEYFGIPAAASSSPIKGVDIQINRPGRNVVVLDINGKKWNGESSNFNEVTLFDLGLRYECTITKPDPNNIYDIPPSSTVNTPKVKWKLSHQYVAPPTTEEERAQVFQTFQKKMDEQLKEQERLQHAMNSHVKTALSPSSSASSPSSPPPPPLIVPIPPRNISVLHAPASVLKSPDIPDDFYDVTREDWKLYAKSIAQSKQMQGAIKAMETEEPPTTSHPPKRRQDYPLTRLRIRLTPHFYVEASFAAHETVNDVTTVLASILRPEIQTFHLFLSPPKQILDSPTRTLRSLGLVPSALIHFSSKAAGDSMDPERIAMKSGKLQPKIEVLPDDYTETREEKAATPNPATNSPDSSHSEAKRPGEGLLKDEWLEKVITIQPRQQAETADAETSTHTKSVGTVDAANKPEVVAMEV